jgi:hypothetical protein
MIDDLTLDDAHARAIIENAIEFGVYGGDEVPTSKKDRMEGAHDVVAMAIDSYANDGVNDPDDEDEETAEAAKQIIAILELASVEIDDDGDITYGELPELEGADEEEEEDGDDSEEEEEDGDEAAFEADDLIDGWSKTSVADAIEFIEAATADDAEDDDALYEDDIRNLLEWENERSKPRKKLVAKLEELLSDSEEEEEEGDDSDDDESEQESGEPWEGYDALSMKDAKQTLIDSSEDEDEEDRLSVEQAQYVLEYETENKNRKGIVNWLTEFIEANSGDEESEEEESEEEDDDEGIDLDALDRDELKGVIKQLNEEYADEDDWEKIKVLTKDDEDDLRAKIRAAIGEDDEEEEEEAEEEPEEKPKSRGKKGKADAEKELDDGLDNAVAADDEKDAKKGKKKAKAADFDASDDEIKKMLPSSLSRAFVESKLHEKHVKQAGLTPPGDYEPDMPQLPEDVGSTTHDELSNLLLQHQSALSTASWRASMFYIEADMMEEIADYLEARAILASDESNDAKRRADAKTDERVVFFRAKQKAAYHDYVRFRDLASDLKGRVAVISRVGGFKDEDEGGSDARVQRAGSSKGTSKGAAKGSAAKKPAAATKPKLGRIKKK